MSRKKIFTDVHYLLDTYCEGCFLKKHFRKEFGKANAQAFCINKCTIGEKLKEYGNKLS
ncbi:zinc-finger domain-containing protein [Bacillus sp. HMF5848]|uniref:zinc-finger domain-containing protein n=1 Tax=Bacillus sp. HMF5848 TaxID=2495421 RepID=UPI000F769DA2|nr:zinc-finger domain-containing protein [Bacillus sp. HMF5848]RSK27321.1 zinc-finger domain-containing protein [Bacillus sp. HMF5848]